MNKPEVVWTPITQEEAEALFPCTCPRDAEGLELRLRKAEAALKAVLKVCEEARS